MATQSRVKDSSLRNQLIPGAEDVESSGEERRNRFQLVDRSSPGPSRAPTYLLGRCIMHATNCRVVSLAVISLRIPRAVLPLNGSSADAATHAYSPTIYSSPLIELISMQMLNRGGALRDVDVLSFASRSASLACLVN